MDQTKVKIGINSLFLIPGKVGGTETYLRGFISALTDSQRKKLIIFTNQENHQTFKGVKRHLLPLYASIRSLRLIIEQLLLPFVAWQKKIDLLISFGYITPLFTHCPKIVVIFDLNWYYHPEEFSFINRLVLKTLVTLSAKTADRVITSSIASKDRISKVLNIPKSKISVVYGGCDTIHFNPKKKNKEVSDKYQISSPYIFTVSAAYKFKNLPFLIKAFAQVKKQYKKPLQLVIVGLKGRGLPDLYQTIKEEKLEIDKDILILGYVPNEDLPSLYASSSIFVFPSLHEGFGFPVLEGMASGVPTLVSNAPPLPELENNAGVIFNPKKVSDLTKAILKVLRSKSLQQSLSKKGRLNAKKFTWNKTSQEILKVTTTLL